MSAEASERDRQLREAIDEWEGATAKVARARTEANHWHQENPPPQQPKSVESFAEYEEFERQNQEYNVAHGKYRDSLMQAQVEERAAQEQVRKLLPESVPYRHKGKRYVLRDGGAVRL